MRSENSVDNGFFSAFLVIDKDRKSLLFRPFLAAINTCMTTPIKRNDNKQDRLLATQDPNLSTLVNGYKKELRPRRLVEQQTTEWLKDNGLNDQYLARLTEEQLRALQACHHLLTSAAYNLTNKQRNRLKNYRRTVRNEKLRHTITQGHTYAILNLNKKLNRQLFKQHRQLNADKPLL
jgi:hypothetical protein